METEQSLTRPLFSLESLIRLIVPIMVEQGLAMMIGLADVVMISGVGEAAVSGVSLVDSVNNLMIQVLSALSAGGAVVIAQYLGRQQAEGAREAGKQLVVVVTLSAMALAAVSALFNGHILRLLFGGIEADVMKNARLYFYLSAASYPFLAVYNSIAGMFRAMGNSKVAMMTSILINLINIGGNALTIYGFHWGVMGAGTASLLSRAVAAFVMFRLISSRHNAVWLEFKGKFRFHADMIRRILNIGIPSGIENGMFHIGKLMTQGIIAGFGTAAITANAIAGSVSSMVMVPGSAIGLAMITVVGQCMGAGEDNQAAGNVKRMLRMAYGAKAVLGVSVYLLMDWILALFGVAAVTAELARNILVSLLVAQLLFWPTAFPLGHALRATGDVRFTMIISVSTMWIFRVGFSYLLAVQLHMGVIGVWYAMYIDWVARTIAFTLRWRGGRWRAMCVI
jgi:putative MATE family efflux protein